MANRLKELIENKYGADKFEFGCEMVAQFVQFETCISLTIQTVRHWTVDESDIWEEAEKPLRALLNVKTIEELYVAPPVEEEGNTAAEFFRP